MEDELIDRNPVPKFRKSLGLRVPSGDEAYTSAELESLFAGESNDSSAESASSTSVPSSAPPPAPPASQHLRVELASVSSTARERTRRRSSPGAAATALTRGRRALHVQ